LKNVLDTFLDTKSVPLLWSAAVSYTIYMLTFHTSYSQIIYKGDSPKTDTHIFSFKGNEFIQIMNCGFFKQVPVLKDRHNFKFYIFLYYTYLVVSCEPLAGCEISVFTMRLTTIQDLSSLVVVTYTRRMK